MSSRPVGGNAKRAAALQFQPLPQEVEARFARRLGILMGLVPLPEMSQQEADWVFEQKLRMGGDD